MKHIVTVRLVLVTHLLVLSGGCASLTPSPTESQRMPPVEEKSSGEDTMPAPPLVTVPKGQSATAPVIALLNDAATKEQQGDFDTAMVVLERAVRIEPRNAFVWHQLARLHLRQGEAGQAETMAKKSSQLAPGDERLQATNWRLIADARRQRGDMTGAEVADAQAVILESRFR